jgi:hypothetical protein
MRLSVFIVLLAGTVLRLEAQNTEKFQEGYIIDKFGDKYSGMIRLDPGDGKKAGVLTFKESRKGKKETYGTDYVRAFVVASDSFTVLKNIPFAQRKIIPSDFARVALVGSGGVLYCIETETLKSSGHAASEYSITEEKLKYFIQLKGKLTGLTQHNMKDFAAIVADNAELKKKILTRKIKYADIELAITEYKQSGIKNQN